MNMKDKKITENQADLDILRKISKNPDTTQRKIANDLGVSLGKVNYCLIKLKEKKAFVKPYLAKDIETIKKL